MGGRGVLPVRVITRYEQKVKGRALVAGVAGSSIIQRRVFYLSRKDAPKLPVILLLWDVMYLE